MAFLDIISLDRVPLTKEMLIDDLKNLGICNGDYLLVHSSLNKIGYIIGKEQTLVEALIEVVGFDGLVVMPTHSGDNSNPEEWSNPPVPKSWFLPLKQNIPAYDKFLTPTRGVGVVPEFFRRYDNVFRSNHPMVSFAAYGKRRKELLKNHPYDYELSDASPLGLMYKWNFKILMLGTNYDSCTAMHLSEYRANYRSGITRECAVMENGKRKWIQYNDLDIDSDIFNTIGIEYEKSKLIKSLNVGYANSKLIEFCDLIDFTTKYLSK